MIWNIFKRKRAPFAARTLVSQLQQAMDARQRKLATWLQEKTLRVRTRTLVMACIGFGVISSGCCGYLIYRAMQNELPVFLILPIRPPILQHDLPEDTIHLKK